MNLQTGARGLRFYPDHFSREAQMAVLAVLRGVLAEAPLFTPRMPKSGRPMSVGMSNCGPLGWISDERGYRYESLHPATRQPWPAIPDILLQLWDQVARYPCAPEACLINYYGPSQKWACIRIATRPTSRCPSCRCRSVTHVCFAWAAANGAIRPDPFASIPAMCSSLVAKRGSPSTALIASTRRHPPCSPKVDGSMSPCGA